MALSYTQPLLRGFRTDRRAAAPTASSAQLNRDISDIDSARRRSPTPLAEVRSRLLGTRLLRRRASRFKLQALELAEQLDPRQSHRGSRSARWPRSTSCRRSPKLRGRRQTLAEADTEPAHGRAGAFKQLIVGRHRRTNCGAPRSTRWTSRCWLETTPIDVDAAIRSARSIARTDISNAPGGSRTSTMSTLRNLAQRHSCRRSTWSGRFELHGTGRARSSIRDNVPGRSERSREVPGGYSDALGTILVNVEYPDWTVSAPVVLPAGTERRQRAAHARAQSADPADAPPRLRQLELQIAARGHQRSVPDPDAVQQPDGRGDARRASWPRSSWRAEESKFEIGTSTNFLRRAGPARPGRRRRDSELRAILDYQNGRRSNSSGCSRRRCPGRRESRSSAVGG